MIAFWYLLGLLFPCIILSQTSSTCSTPPPGVLPNETWDCIIFTPIGICGYPQALYTCGPNSTHQYLDVCTKMSGEPCSIPFNAYNFVCDNSNIFYCDILPINNRTWQCCLPQSPTNSPTEAQTAPTNSPTNAPTEAPTVPTDAPTNAPTEAPTVPTDAPTNAPTEAPTVPTDAPTNAPTEAPTMPTDAPTEAPTVPTNTPTNAPTMPTNAPTEAPTNVPTTSPTNTPTTSPTGRPEFTTFDTALILVLVALTGVMCIVFLVMRRFVRQRRNTL
jgi:hypothetical protein